MAAPTEKPKDAFTELDEVTVESRQRGRVPFVSLYTFPYWLLGLVLLGVYVVVLIRSQEDYQRIYDELSEGIGTTLTIAIGAYLLALLIGLVVGVIRSTPPRTPDRKVGLRRYIGTILRTIVYNIATFYVELMRGLPTLVFLLVMGFILVPMLREWINESVISTVRDMTNNPEIPDLTWRGRDIGTAILGLALIYGAFLSEVFRAGIQSVEKGQWEAARSLGMSPFQVLRLIVIPQAVRRVLPPLGNDFISMIKDTSLVTILGTNDITQLSRRWAGSTFQYLETFLILCFIYLVMTVIGSLLVQLMERYLRSNEY
jgi:polar amino acid transport system permease protein